MTISNPFQPAAKVAKKLKILIYGASGVGKTLAALTFPRPAVIDTEGGTDLYAGRDGIPTFSVLHAKSLTDVEAAIKFIQADSGKTFETLIIDAITVLYDVQKDAAGKAAKKEDEMTPRDWNKVNKRMVNLYNALTNLPCHVVVIAREAELYEGEGLNLKRVGFKADMDKKGVYIFDFIVRMKADRSGEVIKSRGVSLGKTIPAVNWETFVQAAGMFTDGKQAQALPDDQAAEKDAKVYSDAAPNMTGQMIASVLPEYELHMTVENFDKMKIELREGVKNQTIFLADVAQARRHIDATYSEWIYPIPRSAAKEAS
jgi:hypothetical protein